MKLTTKIAGLAAALAVVLALPGAALAQIKVGVTVAATGSAAALGVPARNTFTELWPRRSPARS